MKNKYFYPIFKLKAKSWIRYWLIKKTEFKGKLSEILEGFSFNLQNTLRQKFVKFEIEGHSEQETNIITYTCDGTESGDYYFVYNSTNYQFTMPTIASGDVIYFNTSTLKLYLNSTEITTTTASTGTLIIMSSTPNPSYEQPIKSAGDNVNLLNEGAITTTTENGVTISRVNGNIQLNGTMASDTTTKFSVPMHLKAGTYIFSMTGKNIYPYFTLRNSSNAFIKDLNNNTTTPAKFTIDTEADYYIGINCKYGQTYTSENTLFKLKVEKGSTATPYSPFGMGSITVKITNADETEEQTNSIYTQQPFRSIGDVRDVFFKNTVDSPYYDENLILNGWYERHIIKEDNLKNLNINTWVKGSASTEEYYTYQNNTPILDRANGTNILSNKFISVGAINPSTVYNYNCIGYNSTSSSLLRFWIKASILGNMTIEDYIEQAGIKINYQLADPTNLLCTTEQTNILENLPITYEGQTNVYSIDEVEPYLKIQYWESDENA